MLCKTLFHVCVCVRERERVSVCVDWYTPICTHIGFMACGCVLVRVYRYE